ncbi:hypothetical protein Val02_37400 [Virgisporangium aliadipatigenens]|uniref:PrsW family intramembrane metalloprotease n=1 Tax=Virgisporangium aliadipatigenens TaxID=741659 RepID=A0A8J4DQQ6_9ACTN|nr:PrsW family glutamic-type intramembrane protease [Virgisporangium aliadipatigenens]GIJ46854.1 hypothetical protein Val02_37400 [Virgisporangium aliadipatigenens]
MSIQTFTPHRRPQILGVLATGLVLYWIVWKALVATGDPLYLPALFVVGAATTPLAFAVYVSRLAGPVRVSARAVALYALWGGVVGTVVAGVLETGTARVLGGVPTPFVGLFEESAKLLLPLAVVPFVRYLRHRESDGLLIGVAIGVGFAVLETMGYAFVTLLQSHGNLAAMDHLLIERGILAPAGHAAWTGLAVAALWRFGLQRTVRSFLGFAGTFALVVALHATWDAVHAWWWYAGLAAISLGLLHLRLWRAHR